MNMTTINGRTPEVIKRGLECCAKGKFPNAYCGDCSYHARPTKNLHECKSPEIIVDVIALIQQLERERDAAVAETESLNAEIDAINEDYLSDIHTVREDVQPKWISVEERLPDDLEEVLILVKETELYGQYNEFSRSYFCQYIGSLDDGEWYTVWCNGHRYIKDTAKEPNADKLEVTHWMPLPEPPKEEK